MARRSRLAAWPGRLSLAVLGAMLPLLAAAQEPEVSLADLPINGEWGVVYVDRDLGPIEGRATIDEEAGSAQVVYFHPQSGEKFRLSSTSFQRNGVKISIVFEGQSPVLYRNDGQDYPQRHLIVPEEAGEVTARVGASEANMKLSPRRDSDQERIELELSIEDDSTLSGTWRYRADPFTRRARDGLGRVGEYVLQEDGTGLQEGEESWRRPEPVVLGAFVLQSQTGYNKILDEPHYPHPYQNDKFQGKQTFRTVFIFGTDLPDGRNNRAAIESEIEGVSYGRVVYPDGTFQFSRGFLEPFETGKAKLLKRLELEGLPAPIAQAAIEAFDYLVVEATLSEGVLPGLQPFTVNGSENTWILRFGNNRADIRFIREIDPKAIPSKKIDTFGYTIKHPDQKIARGHLTIEIFDEAPAGDGKFATVKPGRSVSGDIYKTKTYTELPDTIERFRRWGLFPRWDPENVEGSPIVTNPGNYGGRYGTLVLKKDGSFTYKAKENRGDGERFEFTGDAFIPETLRIEVRTELDLDVDVIHVTIGKNGAVQKIGSSPLVPARRTRADPRVYRTAPITLVGSGGGLRHVTTYSETPLNPTIEPISGEDIPNILIDLWDDARTSTTAILVLPAQHDDVVMTGIADPGLISVMPPPARLDVHTTPARFPLGFSYLWKDHLKRAAACYPELKDLDWDRSSNDFVAQVERSLNFEWWKLLIPPTLAFSSVTLTVDFQLGDHAAMLMMRQAFNQILIRKMDELARAASSDMETRAFWVMMSPYRWNPIEHPITQVEFDIQVTGPRGQQLSFLDTFWGEDGQARRYDSLDEIPNWIVKATREAIQAYIKIMAGSLVFSEKIETCDVEGLVKLTGNTFENVQKWLTPRLMRLETNSAAKFQQWVPDYHARLRVEQIASQFWRVKAYAKIADEDTQHLVMTTAVISIPIILVGGWPAVIIMGLSEVALEAAVELPKVLESRSEIAFARGTVDALGYGRHLQAKADEYTFYEYFGRLATVGALELVGGPAMEFVAKAIAAPIKFALWAGRKGLRASARVLNKSLLRFRVGVRYVLARRGEAIFERYLFDIAKLPANLKPRDYKAMMEYVFEAGRLRAAGGLLDDDQIKVLLRLEELLEGAKARPRWARNIDEATHNDIKDLYFRWDIKKLMTSAGDTVAAALRAGGRTRDEALLILRFSSQPTGEHFQGALKRRLNTKREPLSMDAYQMTSSGNRVVSRLLSRARWFINFIKVRKGLELIKIQAPGGTRDELIRGYDSDTGTLTLKSAFRENVPAHIDAGLPHNLSEKGFPAFLFAQLRYMNRVGIGFAGRGGDLLKRVKMDFVVNARTNVQLAWFRKTYYRTKTLEQIAEEGLLDEFLLHTRSVDYARSIINMAGYRIKRVKLDLYGPNSRLGSSKKFYKVAKDGESWEKFLKRYGLAANDDGPPGFNIVIEVEPHPGALRKMAAKQDPPGGSTPGSSGGPGYKTEKLPRTDTEPIGRPPPTSGDGPPAGPGGGDEPLYMARVAQLRQQAEQQAQEALARYRAHQRGDVQLTKEQLDDIFWAIRDRDNLQGGLEQAVSTARSAGVPDDVIAQHVGAYANSLHSNARMLNAVRDIERAHLRKNGYRVLALGDTEAEMINRIVINTQGGRATAEELAFLRQRIAAAKARGRDYFDDLARTGSMTSDEPFELLARADEIKRLRALAKRENLYSGTSRTGTETVSPPPRQQGGRPSPEVTNRSREETRTMGRPDSSGGTQRFPLDMPPSAEAEMRRRLRTLDPLQLQHALRTAGAMQRLGVPEELARELVALNAVRLANPGTQSLNRVIQAQLIAQGILEHGTRLVTLKEFAQAIGVPKSIAEVAAEVAAIRSGYAPLPSEIRPGWLYPPYH